MGNTEEKVATAEVECAPEGNRENRELLAASLFTQFSLVFVFGRFLSHDHHDLYTISLAQPLRRRFGVVSARFEHTCSP
jgi:hypothetical protein